MAIQIEHQPQVASPLIDTAGRAWGFVTRGIRIPAALLLLLAATLKWHQLPVITRMGDDLFHRPWIVFAQIVFKTTLALWLLTGLWPRWSRRVALATFAGFACFTGYKAISGADSCGCFGEFKVNPWVTFCLDLSVIGLLWWRKPEADNGKQKTYASGRVLVAGVAMLLAVGLTLWRMPGSEASAPNEPPGIVFANGSLAILEPEKWIGKPLPLLPYLRAAESESPGRDLGSELRTGRWRVVIYSNDCGHCRELVPKLARRSREGGGVRYAFVELPPYAPAGEELLPPAPEGGWVRAQLSRKHDWFAQTPVVLEMEAGLVQSERQGEKSDELLARAPD